MTCINLSIGIGDTNIYGRHEGCADLLSTVRQRVKPKFHVFGHIHEGLKNLRNIAFL